jgi:RNA polymerase sigma-70 factor (ECF subfamily)
MDQRLGGRLDPSDILQEAYLDAAQRLPEFVAAPQVPLGVWLRALVLQRLVDVHRRHLGAKMRDARREISLDGGDALYASAVSMAALLVDSAKSPASEMVQLERRRRVQEALEALEPLDREVLALRHFEMLGNSETAEILGISVTAASNRYVRAVKRLRVALEERGESG